MNFSNIKADCISSENAAIRFICRTALIYQLVFGWTVREEFWIGFKGISISSLQYTPEKSYENKHQLWDTVWELEIQPWIRNIFRAEFQATFIICSIWINYIQFTGSFKFLIVMTPGGSDIYQVYYSLQCINRKELKKVIFLSLLYMFFLKTGLWKTIEWESTKFSSSFSFNICSAFKPAIF